MIAKICSYLDWNEGAVCQEDWELWNGRQCKPNAEHMKENKCKGRFKTYFIQVSLYYTD